MSQRPNLRSGNADEAAREAGRGAIHGAIRWGTFSALAGTAVYFASPLFRGLTVQFRVYLWMCPTVVGSMVEADRRLRGYEGMVRAKHRAELDKARKQAYLREIQELERKVG